MLVQAQDSRDNKCLGKDKQNTAKLKFNIDSSSLMVDIPLQPVISGDGLQICLKTQGVTTDSEDIQSPKFPA